MSLPCGANVDFNAITDATSDLKTKLTSQLGGNFTSASALKDAVSANITSVSANLSNMLPAIPEVPKLNFQSELTALAGINLSTPRTAVVESALNMPPVIVQAPIAITYFGSGICS